MHLVSIESIEDGTIRMFKDINNLKKSVFIEKFGSCDHSTLVINVRARIIDMRDNNLWYNGSYQCYTVITPVPIVQLIEGVVTFFELNNPNCLCKISYTGNITVDHLQNAMNQYESFLKKEIKGSFQILPFQPITTSELGSAGEKVTEHVALHGVNITDDQLLYSVKFDTNYRDNLCPLPERLFLPRDVIMEGSMVKSKIILTNINGYRYTLYNMGIQI